MGEIQAVTPCEHSKIVVLCALLGAFMLTWLTLPPGTLSETIKTHQQTLLACVEHAPQQSALIFLRSMWWFPPSLSPVPRY